MPDKSVTWIVVANSSQAKIYRLIKFPKIEELELLEHPESRLHSRDLVTSRPGRTTEKGVASRSTYEPPSDPKELEVEKFARFLGEHLNSVHQKGEFSRLYVVAGPSFLGLLRHHINQSTKNAIVAELSKDMADHAPAEIEKLLAAL